MKNSNVKIRCIIKFATLQEAEVHPDYPANDPKFRVVAVTPKTNPQVKELLRVAGVVGKLKWGSEFESRWEKVKRTVEEGDNEGQIGLLDGDQFQPEYNANYFVIKASARGDRKPLYYTPQGQQTETAPKPGDLVDVMLDVWVMKQHKRVNFTIEAIRVLKENYAEFGPAQIDPDSTQAAMLESGEDEEEIMALFDSTGGTPALPAGATYEGAPEDEVEAAPKRPRKKAARKKRAARRQPVEVEVVEDEAEASPPETEGGTDSDVGADLFAGL